MYFIDTDVIYRYKTIYKYEILMHYMISRARVNTVSLFN